MSDRNKTSLVRGLVAATVLAMSPAAWAQETITLEVIGAVRFALPDEVQRMDSERERAAAAHTQSRREEQEASAR